MRALAPHLPAPEVPLPAPRGPVSEPARRLGLLTGMAWVPRCAAAVQEAGATRAPATERAPQPRDRPALELVLHRSPATAATPAASPVVASPARQTWRAWLQSRIEGCRASSCPLMTIDRMSPWPRPASGR